MPFFLQPYSHISYVITFLLHFLYRLFNYSCSSTNWSELNLDSFSQVELKDLKYTLMSISVEHWDISVFFLSLVISNESHHPQHGTYWALLYFRIYLKGVPWCCLHAKVHQATTLVHADHQVKFNKMDSTNLTCAFLHINMALRV